VCERQIEFVSVKGLGFRGLLSGILLQYPGTFARERESVCKSAGVGV